MNIQENAWSRIETFLNRNSFDGFTSNDLFIMKFVKKGWGQDIAALSNMAEAVWRRYKLDKLSKFESEQLLNKIITTATHRRVAPYRNNIESTKNLGAHGYYLEHLNIILGIAGSIGQTEHENLNKRISEHLRDESLGQDNAHAPLLPHVKMRWSADQAAIIRSLHLCDQNYQTDFHLEPCNKWLGFMKNNMTHLKTGLFETEAMRVKNYSRHPRGCALSYLIHYTSSFAPKVATNQWGLYKKYMLTKTMGLTGFREYLPDYKGKWTPDSGPIINGMGVAATGLALKTALSIQDDKLYELLKSSVDKVLYFCYLVKWVPGLSIITAVGTDLLASGVYCASLKPSLNKAKKVCP